MSHFVAVASNEATGRPGNQSCELSPHAQFQAAVSALKASDTPLSEQQPQKAVNASLPSIYQMDAELAKRAIEQLNSTIPSDSLAYPSGATQAQVNIPEHQYAPAPQPLSVPPQAYLPQWPAPSFPQSGMPVNVYPYHNHWDRQSHYTPPGDIDQKIVEHVRNNGASMYHPTPVRKFPISLHQTPPLTGKQTAVLRSTTPITTKIQSNSPAPSTGNTPAQKVSSTNLGGRVRKNNIKVVDLDDPPMCPLCYHMTCLPGSIKAHMQSIHNIPVKQCGQVRTKSQLIAAGYPVPTDIEPQRYKRLKPDEGNLSADKPQNTGQYTPSAQSGGDATERPAAAYGSAPSANGRSAAQQEDEAQTPGSGPESAPAMKARSQPRPSKSRPYLHQPPQPSPGFHAAPDRAQQLTIQQYKRQTEAYEAHQARQSGHGVLKHPKTVSNQFVQRDEAINGNLRSPGHLLGYSGMQAIVQPSYAAGVSNIGGQFSHSSEGARTATAPVLHSGGGDRVSIEGTSGNQRPAEIPGNVTFSVPFANAAQVAHQYPGPSVSSYLRYPIQSAQAPYIRQDELSGLSHAQILQLYNSWPKGRGEARPQSSNIEQLVGTEIGRPRNKGVEVAETAAPPEANNPEDHIVKSNGVASAMASDRLGALQNCDPKCSTDRAAETSSRNADVSLNSHRPRSDNVAPPELSRQDKDGQSPEWTREQITQRQNQIAEQSQPCSETGLEKPVQTTLQHISPALKHYFEQIGKWPTQERTQVAALRALNYELDQGERTAGQKRSFNTFTQDMHDTNVTPPANRAVPQQRESWDSQLSDVELNEGVATASTNISSVVDEEVESELAQEKDTPHKRQKMSYGEIMVPDLEATTAQTASCDADDGSEVDGEAIEIAVPVADRKENEPAEDSRETAKTGNQKQDKTVVEGSDQANDTERENLRADLVATGKKDHEDVDMADKDEENTAVEKSA